MKWTNRGHEFDGIGRNFQGKKIVIYGAADIGRQCYEKMKFLNAVDSFVDKNEELQKDGCMGIPVISVKELAEKGKKEHIIVIAIPGYNGMMVHNQLMHLGYELGKNCFFYDTFIEHYLSIYALYARDILYFPSISFLLTTHCNLNCRGCLNFTKQNSKKRHYEVDELRKNADSFFGRIDFVEKFHMSGGEPFLYPYYEEILEYIGSKYSTQIGNFYTATNGTVVPRESLCKVLKKYNVFVEVDDYRRTLPAKVRKNDEIIQLFKKQGIRYSDRGAGYWINLDPEEQDNSSWSETELGIWYDICNNPFASVHNGRLYSCNYDDYAKEAELISHDANDVVVLEDKTISKKELLEFRHGFSDRGYTEFCKRCAGHEMINKKHIPVAEQYEVTRS